MKYLIDTDVIIDYLRGKAKLSREFVENGSGISIITLGELIYGAYKSISPQQSIETTKSFIEESGIQIVGISQETVYNFGEVKAQLEKSGKRLEDFDLLIAATAKINSLILVSRNLQHFKRIKGLKLFQGEN